MSDTDLGFAKRRLIDKIITDNWNVRTPSDKKYSYDEMIFVLQEFFTEEGKKYLTEHKRSGGSYQVFKYFVELLLYRNLANYDSMVLLTSDKGCITGDALLYMPRDLKKYPKGVPLKDLVNKGEIYVYSFNNKTKKLELKKSDGVEFVKEDDVYELELRNGMKIQATGDHPFMLMNGTYKQLKDLVYIDKIYYIKNNNIMTQQVKHIEYIGKQRVYDVVNVRDNHNFIVNGCVVSNTGKSSAAIMLAKEWCKLIGIKFDPDRHMAYNNADVTSKIDKLNPFEPIICIDGNSRICIEHNGKKYTKKIKYLPEMTNYKVLGYNQETDKFEYHEPSGGTVLTKKNAEVYEITLENGNKIAATPEHQFLTKDGTYKMLKDLTENDELVIRRNIDYNQARATYRKKYNKMYSTSIPFRIRHNVMTRLFGVCDEFLAPKINNDRFVDVVGCTPEELQTYLEYQFIKGMSWDNYGGSNRDFWSIDHIMEINKMKKNDYAEQKKIFHYTNMRPLWNNLNSVKIELEKYRTNIDDEYIKYKQKILGKLAGNKNDNIQN